MKIYSIIANDKKKSLNKYIYKQVTEYIKTKNISVDKLDLYNYEKDIPFYSHDREKLEKNDFYTENKKRFMQANALLIVYPVYWNTVPGILKCWMDLITNFAWKYQSGQTAKALHKIKRALVISTTSSEFNEDDPMNNNSALKNMFKFINIPTFEFYGIGMVNSIKKDMIEKDIKKIFEISDKLFQNI